MREPNCCSSRSTHSYDAAGRKTLRNTMATMTITVGDGTGAIKKTSAPKPQLYSEHGVPKKPGDPPLGIAYDADGLPVPARFSVRERP